MPMFARNETAGVLRPKFRARAVFVVRMQFLNPFGRKRNFERGGAGFGVCDGKMAEDRKPVTNFLSEEKPSP